MDNFQIETAQNVRISQNIAGIGDRILAFGIDILILIAYAVLMSLFMGSLQIPEMQEWVYYLILGLPFMLYFLIWESLWNGRTPGKAALGLRVVKIDGTPPAFSSYLVRWLLRILDITLTSGSLAVISILLSSKGQRIGDLAARTTVISERQSAQLDRSLIEDLPEGYQPVYPQVTVLTDRDVQEIRKLYRNSLKNSNFRILQSLSDKISDLLGVVPEEKPLKFIQTVLKDYTFYTRH